MCVADSKPNDPPAQRAWAISHNAETVAAQAREAFEVARSELERYLKLNGSAPGPVLARMEMTLQLADATKTSAEATASRATRSFAKVREMGLVRNGAVERWLRAHESVEDDNNHGQ